MKTTLRMMSLDHPQFDGQTKHINQFVRDMIQVYVTIGTNISLLLEFAYCNNRHMWTRYSPFTLM